jgi:arabinose-5-phosphate isomerase
VHGDLGTVRDDDLVIILSKSGETAESIYLLEHLKKRKSLIWSMTFNENSRLAKGAPNALVLKMENEGDEWDKVPNNSTTIYLIVLQALAMNVSKRMGVTYEDFIRNHPGGAIGDAARKQ